ncbi:hypothetical protein V8F06_010272 [Rhypophila decipiens]
MSRNYHSIKSGVPMSRPAVVPGEKIFTIFDREVMKSKKLERFSEDPTDVTECLMNGLHRYRNAPAGQPLYMEIFAWSVLPDMRYEILWKYSGAWPSISHVESAVEEALQIEERRSTSTNRPNLKIEMEVIPLGGIRLLEFIHKLQVDVGTLEGNSRELELKVQRQQAKIEAMEQDMLKLKTSLEDRDTMESKLKDAIEDRDKIELKLLRQMFQGHTIQAANNN